jgi:hypothetical protein
MNRILVAALLRGAAALACDDAIAQPHAPLPPWTDPAGPPTEMDVWLRRLVGRFQFDGLVHVVSMGDCAPLPPEGSETPPPFVSACAPVEGVADCIAIGTGPGVQCVLNVRWNDLYDVDFEGGSVTAAPGAVSYLNPSMALFGLDPGQASINYLLVDNKGLPEGGLGSNTGNQAKFETDCVNLDVYCQRIIRIEAKPDARVLYKWIDAESVSTREKLSTITLSMRRIEQAEAAPALAPSGRRLSR